MKKYNNLNLLSMYESHERNYLKNLYSREHQTLKFPSYWLSTDLYPPHGQFDFYVYLLILSFVQEVFFYHFLTEV